MELAKEVAFPFIQYKNLSIMDGLKSSHLMVVIAWIRDFPAQWKTYDGVCQILEDSTPNKISGEH